MLTDNGQAFVRDFDKKKFLIQLSRGLQIFGDDRRAVKESSNKAFQLGLKVIYSSHGKPFPIEAIRNQLYTHTSFIMLYQSDYGFTSMTEQNYSLLESLLLTESHPLASIQNYTNHLFRPGRARLHGLPVFWQPGFINSADFFQEWKIFRCDFQLSKRSNRH